MNDFNDSHPRFDQHAPTPDFRASLKRELLRAQRAQHQFDPPRAPRTRRVGLVLGLVVGALITLPIGLVLGARTGYASAGILEARERESTKMLITSKRRFAAMRLDMARANYDAVRREFEAGTATSVDLRNAKTEVESMEANLARVEQDVAASGAAAPQPPSGLAILRAIPKGALTAITCGAVAAAPQASSAQQGGGIPVVNLSNVSAKTTTTLGAVLGVRELPGRRLLVNDAGRRQIKVFDSTLTNATIGLDSTAGGSNSYGERPATILPYLGDSTAFTEIVERFVLVLDRNGQFARALAPPTYQDPDIPFPVPFPMPRAIDNKGRLIAEGGFRTRGNPVTHVVDVADSTLIFRGDLDSRQVEIIGTSHYAGGKNRSDPPQDGKRVVTSIIQPVPTEDSWAVLSDGTIAFVRGRDYHVDWIHPDGTKSSTAKLPFDWKRLTDEDKQKLVDSARVVHDSLVAIRNARNAGPSTAPGRGEGGGDGVPKGYGRSGGGNAPPGQQGSIQHFEFVPLSEIPDYYPPIHRNAATADLDGNLWILTTTSAQSQHGELVYDVVNPKQGLFQRVRMPLGRSIAGFGKGGIVYLQSGDRTNGFYLERAKLDVAKSATK